MQVKIMSIIRNIMKIEKIIKLWKLNIQIRKILTKSLQIIIKNRYLLKIKIIINYDLI